MKKNTQNINVLIAERILGYEPQETVPAYSSNIEQAWNLIETLGGAWELSNFSTFWQARWMIRLNEFTDKSVTVEADSASMAICLAVLEMNGL